MMNEEMRKMMYGMSRECLLVFLGKFLQIFDGMECQALHFLFCIKGLHLFSANKAFILTNA